jgi:hypothetical protein
MLDEPKYEYHGSSSSLNGTIIDALTKAVSMVAKECWYRGEKEAIRPLWRETTVALDSNQRAVMPEAFMFIESVRSNFHSSAAKPYLHSYVDPGIFRRRQMRNPSEGNSGASVNGFAKFISRAEYTIIGRDVYATGSTAATTNNKNVIISYIRVPTVSTVLNDAMPLAEYMHATIGPMNSVTVLIPWDELITFPEVTLNERFPSICAVARFTLPVSRPRPASAIQRELRQAALARLPVRCE